ncbi:sugar kinase [Mucilaginibacter sp. L3T2-6]|uniref:sugar kinase n=1 Tax=Mucilaginibacter sp. L3T2-6 TaxID=3062491 RepID=UPI002676E9D7|nr:sugar kinase [Mucilaginibacter sp. L3T2-6]MDO3640878.1 sugar kinase [Mucilaginibacter sp. L3T2-6]MDV6213646.1 sugar kinase [Mucilaginibacter sp. L3T2-6]
MSATIHHQPGKILSFGELLLRITPDAGGRWLNENQLPFYVGGAELNVATALALWELPSRYFTALPNNSLSVQIIKYLSAKGIDTSPVSFGDGRLGLYFLTSGQDLKHDALVYDRSDSAFSNLKPGMIDWDEVLEGVTWFHFSAICPAINQNVANVCEEVLRAASAKGITISVDLNYRSKLWKYGKSPREVMPDLTKYCDLIMGNVWAAETMLGIPVAPNIHESGQQSIYLKEALHSSENIMLQFPKCKAVANTFRFDASSEINYYTTLYTGGKFYNSRTWQTTSVIDKVGSGDCFMAGIIYGFYRGWEPAETLEFATAAAFEQLFVKSDATDKTVADIQSKLREI